jgi:hypothetical protein
VKNATVIVEPADLGPDHRTRHRVAQLLLERGSATAAEIGTALGLSPATAAAAARPGSSC